MFNPHWNLITVKRGETLSPSASIRRFVITATTAFTFKTLLRHYAKRALTPRSLNVKLGPRRNYHKGRAAIRHYANQTARPFGPSDGPIWSTSEDGVSIIPVSRPNILRCKKYKPINRPQQTLSLWIIAGEHSTIPSHSTPARVVWCPQSSCSGRICGEAGDLNLISIGIWKLFCN